MTQQLLENELVRLGSRLKTLRAERGWTLEELAGLTDLSPPYLSRLEAGDRQPSLAALISLAQAFAVPLAALFEPQTPSSRITVTRSDATPRWTGNGFSYVPLTGGVHASHLNAVLVQVPAHRDNTDLSHHDSEELVFVLDGRVKLRVGDETVLLEPGDSAHYDARAPHRCDARDGLTARILIVTSTAPKTEFEFEAFA